MIQIMALMFFLVIIYILAHQTDLSSMQGFNNNQGFNNQGFNNHGHQHHDKHNQGFNQQQHTQPFIPNPNAIYKIVSAENIHKAISVGRDLIHPYQLCIRTYEENPKQQFQIELQNGKYTFKSLADGGVLHVTENSDHSGAHTRVQAFNKKHTSIYWEVVMVNQGEWAGKGCFIRSFCGKVLDLEKGNLNDGNSILQNDYLGGVNQIWLILPSVQSNNQQGFNNNNSQQGFNNNNQQQGFNQNKSVEVKVGNNLGFNVQITTHNNNFQFIPNPNVDYKIFSAHDISKCIAFSEGHHHKGKVVLEEYHGSGNQRFHIEHNNGKYVFKQINGHGVVHIPNENSNDNAELTVAKAHHHSSQFWEIVPVTEGQFAGKAHYLRSFCGKALDIQGGNLHNHTPIIQHSFTGSVNQTWFIAPA